MASPAISPKFRSKEPGFPFIDSPSEWVPALIDLDVPWDMWLDARVYLQNKKLDVHPVQAGDGSPIVIAEWPRSGPGHYRLETKIGESVTRSDVTIRPSKISEESYEQLIDDLEDRLPASIAIGLQAGGALGGLNLTDRSESTLAEQVVRLRRAVMGTGQSLGLAAVLPLISESPHSILLSEELWVKRDQARRPPAHRFPQAVARIGNLGEDRLPIQVMDSRVERSFDVYENRLLKFFVKRVQSKLNVLLRILRDTNKTELLNDAADSLERLQIARRIASFLDQVRDVPNVPDSISMVFIKEPRYRTVLDRYIEYKKSFTVTVDEPALETPLNNLPTLYQSWSTMSVIDTLLTVGHELGFRVESEQLYRRDFGDFCIRILPEGRPVVVLRHDGSQTKVALIPEPSYAKQGTSRSVSFQQKPDIAITVERPGLPSKIILFDPKYKLDGEDIPDDEETLQGSDTGSTNSNTRPKKVDIDKMHAYRDSIRTVEGERVVAYAGILYPGETLEFSDDIQALRAVPGESLELSQRVREILISHLAE